MTAAAPEPTSDADHETGERRPDGRTLTWSAAGYWAAIALATAGVLVSALPLLPVNLWWIRIGDYPRIQLLIGVLASLAFVSAYLPRRPAIAGAIGLVIATAIQIYFIYPYTPLAAVESQRAKLEDPARTLRVFACNVLQKNDDHAAVRQVIGEADADIVLLMEVNERWVDAVAEAVDGYPHKLEEPLDNKYGMAFYSRLPVTSLELRHYVKDDIPSIVADVQLRNGTTTRVFCVHPNPPRPGEDTTKRDGELVLVGRDVKKYGGPAIVVGDMNDVGWSRTSTLFQKVSRLLDPRKGRGFYNTFDATSFVWRYPLDYVYHSDEFRLRRLERLAFVGSDHFPLFIELSYEPDAEDEQEAPDKDPGDAEDAADAVENAREAAADPEETPTEKTED